MGKRFRIIFLTLFLIIINSIVIMANPNKGYALHPDGYTKRCSFYSGVDSPNYIDNWVPYEKTIWSMGGYAIEDGDLFDKMPDSLYNCKVGSIVDFQNKETVLDEEYLYKNEDINVYIDDKGAVYYGVSLPREFFDILIEDQEYLGRLCDIILVDGTCYHCVVASIESPITRSNYVADLDTYQPYVELELSSYGCYNGYFNSSDGSICTFIGNENDKISNEISVNPVSFIRVYDDFIYESPSRPNPNSVVDRVDFEDSDVEYYKSLYKDQIENDNHDGEYDPDVDSYDETEDYAFYGMGKKSSSDDLHMGSSISQMRLSSTKEIIKAHLKDFTSYDELKSFLSKKGGGSTKKGMAVYLDELGGVFKKHGTKKIKLQTMGDIDEALDFMYGIIALWGFSYGNPKYNIYHRWNGNHGGCPYAVWNSGYRSTVYGAGNVITNANCTGKKHNTACIVCQTTTYMIYRATKCKRAVGNGKEYKVTSNHIAYNSSRTAQDNATKHYYGKARIKKAADLRTLDELQKSGHTWFVYKNDPDKGKLIVCETGGSLIGPAKIYHTKTYKKGASTASVLGGDTWGSRIIDLEALNLDNSKASGEDPEDGEKNEETEAEAVDKRSKGLIPDEKDLVGMDGVMDKISDEADPVSLPDSTSLKGQESYDVSQTQEIIEHRPIVKLTQYLRAFVVALGILLITYIGLIIAAYIFDTVNSLFDIHLCGILTFGKVEGRVGDNAIDSMHLKNLILICCLTFAVATLLITGGIYDIITVVFNKVSGLL